MGKLNKNSKEFGFSLIEVAIATVVVGVVSVMIVTMMSKQMNQHREIEKAEKEDILRNAIAEYIKLDPSDPIDVVNYPCPADPSVPKGDPNFGVEQRNAAGNCMAFGAIQEVTGTDGRPVFIGAVPTSTLGLSANYAVDSYNRRFTYAVSGDVAENNAMAAGSTANGAIEIVGDGSSIVTRYSPFIVVSHGKDGKGSYSSDGVLDATGCVGDGDSENCNNDGVFAMRQLVTADTNDKFDDYVTFNIEDKRITVEDCPIGSQMIGVSEGKPVCHKLVLVCPPGQVLVGIDGATPLCQPAAVASATPTSPRTTPTRTYVPPTSNRVTNRSTTTTTTNDEGWLGAMYREEHGRAPDAAGAAYWEAQEANGMSREEIRGYISGSCEAQGTCHTTSAGQAELAGQANYATDYTTKTGNSASARSTSAASRTTARTDTSQYTSNSANLNKASSAVSSMDSIYKETLGRAPDAAGAAYWKKQMDNGMSASEVKAHMSNSCEAKGTC